LGAAVYTLLPWGHILLESMAFCGHRQSHLMVKDAPRGQHREQHLLQAVRHAARVRAQSYATGGQNPAGRFWHGEARHGCAHCSQAVGVVVDVGFDRIAVEL